VSQPLDDHPRQQIRKTAPIGVATVDAAPLIATASDMPDGTWKPETKLTGHGEQEKSATMGDSVRGRCEGITRSAATGLDDVKLSFQM
jgi:hypothetical protein